MKKKYAKPAVKKVKLAMKDAVLTGCKTSATPTLGTMNMGCGHPQCKNTFGS